MVRASIHRVVTGLLVLGLGWAGAAWPAQADAPAT